MTSKIRIKMGAIEVEYEGAEQFLREDLPDLLTAVSNLYKAGSNDNRAIARTESNPSNDDSHNNDQDALPTLTTGSIAAKLEVASGPDLLTAAAARMNLIEKRETFTRQELLAEIKTATAYYKVSMGDNLTRLIQSLVKQGTFVESAKNVFSLSASTRTAIKTKLAD